MGPRFERATLGCKVQGGQGGCRLQGAGIASARREGQVQQGAGGRVRKKCGRCRARRGGQAGCRDDLARVPACDNVPSALVDHTCVWLSGWISEARERYAGTWAKHVRMHGSLPYRELQTWLATQVFTFDIAWLAVQVGGGGGGAPPSTFASTQITRARTEINTTGEREGEGEREHILIAAQRLRRGCRTR